MIVPSTDSPVCQTKTMTVWLESPDIICIRGFGDISPEHMAEVAVFDGEHIRHWPHAFALADQTKQTAMSAEARKVAARVFEWVPFRGTAFYGGSFALGTIARMIMTILNAVTNVENPLIFVKTEDDGRAWIDARRRELAKKA